MKSRLACCIALAHILSFSHAKAQTQSPRQEYRTTANQETVLQSELVSVPGKEATVVRVELPAGWIGDWHYHTGDVFVYLLSGEFVVDLENQGRKRFGPGQVYHEAVNTTDAGPKSECDSAARRLRAKHEGLALGTDLKQDQFGALCEPPIFFENVFPSLGLIKQQGINGGPIAADLPFPMIATRDIADAAARALRQRDWRGVVVRELLGERDLTLTEATRIIGTRIGKPDLTYVQFPYADFTASLVGMGISSNVAALYAQMARAVNDGRVKSREGRRPENTTPTRFEAFADTLARAFQPA